MILPTASRGIYGSIILAFGRAAGRDDGPGHAGGQRQHPSPWSLFAPGNTLAALLANKLPEAGHGREVALMYAALVLLGITLLVNIIGRSLSSATSLEGQR